MTTVYLAGPMTGLPRWNFDAFESAAADLRASGYEVWSPHERDLDEGFDPDSDGSTFDLRAALEADIDAVASSDVVGLLPGWRNSPGVMIELTVASALGISVGTVSQLLADAASLAVGA